MGPTAKTSPEGLTLSGVEVEVPDFLPVGGGSVGAGGVGGAEGEDCGCSRAVRGEGDGRKVKLRGDVCEGPSAAAVVSEGEVGAVFLGMLVVATGDDAVFRVAESDGEDASGVGSVDDGSFGDSPALAGVGGAKYAGGFPSGSKPDIVLSLDGDTGSAGGEGAFTGDGGRDVADGRFQCLPPSAVEINSNLLFYGVADGDAAVGVPEGHAIEEAFRVLIGELQRPGFAGVGGFVDAGLVAGAGCEQIGEI